jgi:hypothetical protein
MTHARSRVLAYRVVSRDGSFLVGLEKSLVNY